MKERCSVACFLVALMVCSLSLLAASSLVASDGELGGEPKAIRALPRSGLLVVPAAAFHADGFSPDSTFFPFGGGYVTGDSTNYGCMVAPAYLPHGAEVLAFYASVYDNDPARAISIALRRVDNFSGTEGILAVASTTADFAGIQVIHDFSITDPLILYPNYSYYLTVCMGSDSIRLYSARINTSYLFDDGFDTGNTSAWSATLP